MSFCAHPPCFGFRVEAVRVLHSTPHAHMDKRAAWLLASLVSVETCAHKLTVLKVAAGVDVRQVRHNGHPIFD